MLPKLPKKERALKSMTLWSNKATPLMDKPGVQIVSTQDHIQSQ